MISIDMNSGTRTIYPHILTEGFIWKFTVCYLDRYVPDDGRRTQLYRRWHNYLYANYMPHKYVENSSHINSVNNENCRLSWRCCQLNLIQKHLQKKRPSLFICKCFIFLRLNDNARYNIACVTRIKTLFFYMPCPFRT